MRGGLRWSLCQLARIAVVGALGALSPATTHAQDLTAVLLDTSYTTPVRLNLGGSLMLFGRAANNVVRGPIVGGRAGLDGKQVWVGWAGLAKTAGGLDVRGVVTRTGDHPHGADADSTYVGGEVGWPWVARLSVGFATLISGASSRRDRIVTWGLGAHFPVWVRRSPER